MNIGILTFHNALNYGAVLQTYATQELLKDMGHNVEIIDYRNPQIEANYQQYEFSLKNLTTLNLRVLLKSIIVPYLHYRRKLRYKTFLKKLNLSKSVVCGERIVDYDVILIGSDQVWSLKHTGGFDAMYWGNFPVLPETKKIAWSVCMGDSDMNTNNGEIISSNLQNFSNISVREQSLKNYLNIISDRMVSVTLDPTLVADCNIWKSLCHPVKESDYILVYAVKFLQMTLSIAKECAKVLNKKVVVVSAYSGKPLGRGVKLSCGPQDFLSYIKNASFVVTSSFHGSVFSILFEKEFVSVIPEGKSNVRVRCLLESLNLSERIVCTYKDIRAFSKINYDDVNSILDKNKTRSIEFLHNSLN